MGRPYETPLVWKGLAPKEVEWYARLAQKLEIPFNRVVVYHAVMHIAREEEYSAEQRASMFTKESPENRRILLGILEKIVEGENLPDIDKI